MAEEMRIAVYCDLHRNDDGEREPADYARLAVAWRGRAAEIDLCKRCLSDAEDFMERMLASARPLRDMSQTPEGITLDIPGILPAKHLRQRTVHPKPTKDADDDLPAWIHTRRISERPALIERHRARQWALRENGVQFQRVTPQLLADYREATGSPAPAGDTRPVVKRKQPFRPKKAKLTKTAQLRIIREWANAHHEEYGFPPVSIRGKIPARVMAAYEAAHAGTEEGT